MIPPRPVPNRDSKYMGEAWMKAAFSKDPNTQMGAVIIDADNQPLGSGYNGPPAAIADDSFSWCRPETPDEFSKYDVVIHAEINAIRHSRREHLQGATLYVTGFPCKDCMLEIIDAKISRVVYYDFQSDSGSMLRDVQREHSRRLANLANIRIEEFAGDVTWLEEWTKRLRDKGVFRN